MRKRTSILITLAASLMSLPGAVAAMGSASSDTAYQAHPARDFGVIESQQATFLLTQALQLIYMAYDSSDATGREGILQQLNRHPAIRDLLGLDAIPPAERYVRIQGALATWSKYPSIAANPGSYAGVDLDTRKLLTLAHALVRLGYELGGVARPTTAAGIAGDTVYGAHPMYQPERVAQIREALDNACTARDSALDHDAHLPAAYRWARLAMRVSPALANEVADGFLGAGHSCGGLTHDVLAIVGPHHSPLKVGAAGKSQLEGLSLYLTEAFFASPSTPEASPLRLALHRLRQTERLDARVRESDAVRAAVGAGLSQRELVQLMALTTHNHGLELYLQKAALELENDPARAVELALTTAEDLNHFYGLLSAHRAERRAIQPSDALAQAERPYHYWGGALVACELKSRGYPTWLAAAVSGMLGEVYERWTDATSEGLPAQPADVNLHILGAAEWVSACP